jgi:hypothetical protein
VYKSKAKRSEVSIEVGRNEKPARNKAQAVRSARFEPAVSFGELKAFAVVVREAAINRVKPLQNAAQTLDSSKSRITQLIQKLEVVYGPMIISGRSANGADVSMNARNLAGLHYVCEYWHRLIQSPDPLVQQRIRLALEKLFEEQWSVVDGQLVAKELPGGGKGSWKEGLF